MIVKKILNLDLSKELQGLTMDEILCSLVLFFHFIDFEEQAVKYKPGSDIEKKQIKKELPGEGFQVGDCENGEDVVIWRRG